MGAFFAAVVPVPVLAAGVVWVLGVAGVVADDAGGLDDGAEDC